MAKKAGKFLLALKARYERWIKKIERTQAKILAMQAELVTMQREAEQMRIEAEVLSRNLAQKPRPIEKSNPKKDEPISFRPRHAPPFITPRD
ncbi:MAG: hypothetical protein ABIB04_00695 [Patescibacteria group bacterium]